MQNTDTLPKYSNEPNFVGYPLFYIIDDMSAECHECAQDSKIEGRTVLQQCNWDNPQLYCFECSCQIEAAYTLDQPGEDSESQEDWDPNDPINW